MYDMSYQICYYYIQTSFFPVFLVFYCMTWSTRFVTPTYRLLFSVLLGHLLYDMSYQICYYYSLAYFRFIWSSTVGHELPNLLPLENPSQTTVYSFLWLSTVWCDLPNVLPTKNPFWPANTFFHTSFYIGRDSPSVSLEFPKLANV